MSNVRTPQPFQAVTRQELYDLLWSISAERAAMQLGISGSYLTRVCRWLDVPKPPRGYWEILSSGGHPARPSLPDYRPGLPTLWSKRNRLPQPPAQRVAKHAPSRPLGPSAKQKMHVIIRDAEKHFRTAETGQDGYLRPRKKLLPDVVTTRQALDKSLRFASVLYNALEAGGHRSVIAEDFERLIRVPIDAEGMGEVGIGERVPWSPLRPTVAYVHGVPIGLIVEEISEPILMRYVGGSRFIPDKDYRDGEHFGNTWATTKLIPTGRLRLTAYSPFHDIPWRQRWDERQRAGLHTETVVILLSLESAALELSQRLERAGRYFG